MTFKAALTWLAITAAVFLLCCFVMLRVGPHMNAPAIVYPFMVAWGFNALAWPLFLVLAFRARNGS
jgi:hypothetical protein